MGNSLTKVLTMSAEPAWSLCFPAVTMSNFWPAVPSQAFTSTGMRFSLKSPAVALMDRHWPAADLRETEENARVAVSSRGFASAAAEGISTPPALATEVESLVVVEGLVAGCGSLAGVLLAAGAEVDAGGADEAGEAGAGAGAEAGLSPKVKDWFASSVLQEA